MSGKSLKSFIPGLADAVGMTPAALYERQRALVRAGLLKAEPGRGPGSGVRATPKSVALLLIALMAPGGLSETESEAAMFANLKSDDKSGLCPLTGKRTFGTALTLALSSADIAQKIRWLEVGRRGAKNRAFIVSLPDERRVVSDVSLPPFDSSGFGAPDEKTHAGLGFQSTLALPFHEIARLLKEDSK